MGYVGGNKVSEELRLFDEYTLTKKGDTGERDWVDQSGCHWDDPADWFFVDILGGCGCGTTSVPERAVSLLEYFATDHMQRTYKMDLTDEVIAHWFDSHDLIEHGTSIYGSWLTDKGREIYEVLQSTK